MEIVGMGELALGDGGKIPGWQITFLPPDDDTEEGDIPGFTHYVFPAAIFSNYAREFGLDVDDDDDFDEILDIVIHDAFAGNDLAEDDIDEPQLAARGRPDRMNRVGRRMRRRAARGKANANVTGVDLVRGRLRENRTRGADDMESRIRRVEKARARNAPDPARAASPGVGKNRSIGIDRAVEAADRRALAADRNATDPAPS